MTLPAGPLCDEDTIIHLQRKDKIKKFNEHFSLTAGLADLLRLFGLRRVLDEAPHPLGLLCLLVLVDGLPEVGREERGSRS